MNWKRLTISFLKTIGCIAAVGMIPFTAFIALTFPKIFIVSLGILIVSLGTIGFYIED